MDKKYTLLLLELFLLRKSMQFKFDHKTILDFRSVVSDSLVKSFDIFDFYTNLRFFSITDDKDFSYLCRHFSTYVRSFYKVLDKK